MKAQDVIKKVYEEVNVPEHPFGKGLPNPMGVQDEINKAFEPSVFQKEVIAAMNLEKNNFPLDVHRLRRMTGKTVIGIDLAEKGGDKTSIVEAIQGKHGEIFIIDEYSSMPDWKWYRNPIKWWKWRRFWKSVLKSSKNFTVNIDLDKSVKKNGRA